MLSHLKITVVVAQKMGRLGALSAGQPYTEGWASRFRDGRSPLFHRPPISLFKPSLSNPSLFFACLLSSCSPHLRRTTADHSQTRGNDMNPPPFPTRSKMWLLVARHLWSAQWRTGNNMKVSCSLQYFLFNLKATTKNDDRVGRVQWVRAGLALGYSHPNITGFPRSTILTWDSVSFNQKITKVSITNPRYCNFTWTWQVHNGRWPCCRRIQSPSGRGLDFFVLFYQFNQISIESLEVVNDDGDNDMYLHRLNEVMRATMNVRSLSQKVDE